MKREYRKPTSTLIMSDERFGILCASQGHYTDAKEQTVVVPVDDDWDDEEPEPLVLPKLKSNNLFAEEE